MAVFDFTLNEAPNVSLVNIGKEQTPLLIIDDFANTPTDIIAFAGDGSLFKASINNFYPGKRLLTPKNYSEALCRKYSALLHNMMTDNNHSSYQSLHVLFCYFYFCVAFIIS